jgi:hypothetical protein
MHLQQLLYPFNFMIFAAGCGPVGEDYIPLGTGHRWEYVIEERVNDKHEILKSLVANLKHQKIDGIEYYPRRNANGETYYINKSVQGIFVSPNPGHPGKIILGFPIQTGTSWQTETGIEILQRRHESFSGGESFISLDHKIMLDFHIASMDDPVEVPAGRFPHCMRIEGTGSVTVEARTRGIDHIIVEQREWYAKGIGLVKRIRTETGVPGKYKGEQILELIKWDS